MIYFLFAMAVVLFVVGVFYLYRGYRTNLEEKNAVPLQNFKEIQELKKASAVLREEAVPLTKHLVQENLKSDLPVVPETKKETSRIEELLAENQRLQMALHQEVSSKDTSTLSAVEREKLKEKEQQLKQAHDIMAQLTEESSKWKKQCEEKSSVIHQLESLGEEQKRQHELLQSELRAKLKSLEENLDALTKESQALRQSDESQKGLREDNESFKKIIEEQARQVAVLEETLASSRQEGEQLKLQAHNAFEHLKNDNRLLKEQWQRSEEDLQRLHLEAASIKQEAENRIQQTLSEIQHQSSASTAETDYLKKEYEGVLQTKAELELSLTKIKEFNAHLLEKEKILRYELTKSRAQALGFEKLCEDFKIRIERQVHELDHIRK